MNTVNLRRRLAGIAVAAAVVMVTPSAGVAQTEDKATGLDRAREATAQGLERARGMAGDAPGQVNRARGLDPDRARGLDRAAEAIERARDRADERARGNGQAEGQGKGRGNAFGRGHAEEVHRVLAGGGSPSELAGQHSDKVRTLVEAYNELKRSAGD